MIYRQTCDYCSRKKVKCSGCIPGGKCTLCTRKDVDCYFSVKQKPGPKPGERNGDGSDGGGSGILASQASSSSGGGGSARFTLQASGGGGRSKPAMAESKSGKRVGVSRRKGGGDKSTGKSRQAPGGGGGGTAGVEPSRALPPRKKVPDSEVEVEEKNRGEREEQVKGDVRPSAAHLNRFCPQPLRTACGRSCDPSSYSDGGLLFSFPLHGESDGGKPVMLPVSLDADGGGDGGWRSEGWGRFAGVGSLGGSPATYFSFTIEGAGTQYPFRVFGGSPGGGGSAAAETMSPDAGGCGCSDNSVIDGGDILASLLFGERAETADVEYVESTDIALDDMDTLDGGGGGDAAGGWGLFHGSSIGRAGTSPVASAASGGDHEIEGQLTSGLRMGSNPLKRKGKAVAAHGDNTKKAPYGGGGSPTTFAGQCPHTWSTSPDAFKGNGASASEVPADLRDGRGVSCTGISRPLSNTYSGGAPANSCPPLSGRAGPYSKPMAAPSAQGFANTERSHRSIGGGLSSCFAAHTNVRAAASPSSSDGSSGLVGTTMDFLGEGGRTGESFSYESSVASRDT